jgi:hypothetical protein
MTVSAAIHDLDRIRQLYSAGFSDLFLENALRRIVARQIARDQADLQRVNEALEQFQAQYGLTSDEFWQRFQAGQMPDTADFMEWNVFCKMRQRILTRLHILSGGELHG